MRDLIGRTLHGCHVPHCCIVVIFRGEESTLKAEHRHRTPRPDHPLSHDEQLHEALRHHHAKNHRICEPGARCFVR